MAYLIGFVAGFVVCGLLLAGWLWWDKIREETPVKVKAEWWKL
jgi:hypothetical protein